MLLEAGAKPTTTSVSRRSALWTACIKGLRDVALILLEHGADPYAAPQGAESPADALRRIGGKAATELHRDLTAASAAQAGLPAEETAEDDGEEGEEDEEEEADEEDEEELEARKALAAAAPKEVYVPSLHPHPLEQCHRSHYCNVRGPGCKLSPTTYTCVECSSRYACMHVHVHVRYAAGAPIRP